MLGSRWVRRETPRNRLPKKKLTISISAEPFNKFWLRAHEKIKESGVFNFQCCRIVLPSNFNFPFLEQHLVNYRDKEIIQFFKYGFPLSHDGTTGCSEVPTNHKGATQFPVKIREALRAELERGSVVGPFQKSPFEGACFSPLNSVPKKDSDKCRLILDLSFPEGNSFSEGIDKDSYLEIEEKLVLPSIDQLADRISKLGVGCKIFKIDLVKAYHQIYLDPLNICLVGFEFDEKLFFDCTLSMGSCSSTRCCQRVTSIVVYIHNNKGYFSLKKSFRWFGRSWACTHCWRSISTSQMGFNQLWAPRGRRKNCPPCLVMVFLGIEVNTLKMTLRSQILNGKRSRVC